MIRFRVALLASLSLAAVGAASAADLPSRKGPPVMPIMALYSWQGFYTGLNVGYGFVNGDVVGVTTLPAGPFIGNFGSVDGKGVAGGVQIGYNWQSGSIVYGLEADFQLAGIRDTTTFAGQTTRASIDWFGTVRGRLGYAWDRTLFYATGGVAFTDVNYRAFGGPLALLANSDVRVGWTAGGGIEHAFTNAWSAKIEYLYVSTGKNVIANVPATFSTNETQSFHLARVGVNYRW